MPWSSKIRMICGSSISKLKLIDRFHMSEYAWILSWGVELRFVKFDYVGIRAGGIDNLLTIVGEYTGSLKRRSAFIDLYEVFMGRILLIYANPIVIIMKMR